MTIERVSSKMVVEECQGDSVAVTAADDEDIVCVLNTEDFEVPENNEIVAQKVVGEAGVPKDEEVIDDENRCSKINGPNSRCKRKRDGDSKLCGPCKRIGRLSVAKARAPIEPKFDFESLKQWWLEKPLNIVVLSLSLIHHCLEVCKILAEKGHHVTLVSRPATIAGVNEPSPPNLTLTSVLPDELLLKRSKFDWLFYDFSAIWVRDLAMEVKTSSAYFTPCWSFFFADFYNPTENSAWLLPAWLLPWMEKSCSNWVEDSATSWLDNQAETSVLYIAFGPNANLSRETMNEVAFGIEASGLPFLWDLSNDLVDLLPEGFEDRTTDRGFIWKSSSPPDIRFLAHSSVGGYLTGSRYPMTMMVSFYLGNVLIMLPSTLASTSTEALFSRVMVEKQLGFEIAGYDKVGSISRVSVATILRSAMVNDEVRGNIEDMSMNFDDQEMLNQYFESFIAFLQKYKLLKVPSAAHGDEIESYESWRSMWLEEQIRETHDTQEVWAPI